MELMMTMTVLYDSNGNKVVRWSTPGMVSIRSPQLYLHLSLNLHFLFIDNLTPI